MPVKVYVGRDSEEHQWAPDYAHEAGAAQELVGKLWSAFHHLPHLYAVLVNQHRPNADMVIITERGVGVVELKHYFGRIRIGADGAWYAGGHPIRSGVYTDPHQQVQAYAEGLRRKTLQFILPKWLKRQSSKWDDLKFQTAICFTNPDAEIAEVKKQVREPGRIRRAPWESQFSVTAPEEIPDWVASLRFEVDMGRGRRFEPYRLDPDTIVKVARLVLGGTAWTEILDLMPKAQPYAFVELQAEDEPFQTVGLTKDEVVIGRDPTRCEVVIPRRFSRVSRVHATIIRHIGSTVIEDESTHGTFIDERRVSGRELLTHDQEITLGGPFASRKVCQLRFVLRESARVDSPSTEVNGSAMNGR